MQVLPYRGGYTVRAAQQRLYSEHVALIETNSVNTIIVSYGNLHIDMSIKSKKKKNSVFPYNKGMLSITGVVRNEYGFTWY
jgi:hypothetical protein